jgi:hypothetical protein
MGNLKPAEKKTSKGRIPLSLAETKASRKRTSRRGVFIVMAFVTGATLVLSGVTYTYHRLDFILIQKEPSASERVISILGSTPAVGESSGLNITVPPTLHPTSSLSEMPTTTPAVSSAPDCLTSRGSSGRWIQDWQYANRTNYIKPNQAAHYKWHTGSRLFKATPEQPFRYATSFRWEDDHCPVSEISRDGFCATCCKLGISRLLILGDSMSSEFHQSMLGLLGFDPLVTIQSEVRGRHPNGRDPYDIVCHCQNSPRNVTILYVPRQGMRFWATKLAKDTALRSFVEERPNRTAIVANMGAHAISLVSFTKGFHSLLSWIDSLDPSKIVVFFRDTVPGNVGCQPNNWDDPDSTTSRDSANSFNWTIPVLV